MINHMQASSLQNEFSQPKIRASMQKDIIQTVQNFDKSNDR